MELAKEVRDWNDYDHIFAKFKVHSPGKKNFILNREKATKEEEKENNK